MQEVISEAHAPTTFKGYISGKANHCADAGRQQANNALQQPVPHPQQLSGKIASTKTSLSYLLLCQICKTNSPKSKGLTRGGGRGGEGILFRGAKRHTGVSSSPSLLPPPILRGTPRPRGHSLFLNRILILSLLPAILLSVTCTFTSSSATCKGYRGKGRACQTPSGLGLGLGLASRGPARAIPR